MLLPDEARMRDRHDGAPPRITLHGENKCNRAQSPYSVLAISDTHIGCRATHSLCNVRYCHSVTSYAKAMRCPLLRSPMVLRRCYAVCGTEIGYGATAFRGRRWDQRRGVYGISLRAPIPCPACAVSAQSFPPPFSETVFPALRSSE
eukprot:355333-Rhodomonas_salina.1